MVKAKML